MDLRITSPEEAGFDTGSLSAIRKIIYEGLENGQYPGAAYVIGRHGKILNPECFGVIGYGSSINVTPGTLYDIASLTKPIATAISILILYEQGKIRLEQPVSDYFPHSGKHFAYITVKHLLTHTSGISAYKNPSPNIRGREEIISELLSIPPDNPPGKSYTYSCIGFVLLGEIVEVVSGMSLDKFVTENVLNPLEMRDTCFNPSGELLGRTASTGGLAGIDSVPVGVVHDPLARALGGVSGNAGLFSNILDLSKLCVMLMSENGGLISPMGKRLMYENLLSPEIGGQTAGWFIHPNKMLPFDDSFTIKTIGHTGFTGVSIVIDPSFDLFVTLLTNRVCRADDGVQFRLTRRLFHNTIAKAVLHT